MPIYPAIPDFDMLVRLYQEDQDAFEALRHHLLRDAVNSAPPERQKSLARLLERINAGRTGATPQQAAIQAFEMMADSLQDLRISWHQACSAMSELQTQLLLHRMR